MSKLAQSLWVTVALFILEGALQLSGYQNSSLSLVLAVLGFAILGFILRKSFFSEPPSLSIAHDGVLSGVEVAPDNSVATVNAVSGEQIVVEGEMLTRIDVRKLPPLKE